MLPYMLWKALANPKKNRNESKEIEAGEFGTMHLHVMLSRSRSERIECDVWNMAGSEEKVVVQTFPPSCLHM